MFEEVKELPRSVLVRPGLEVGADGAKSVQNELKT
jgi:hypothetical protein